MALANAEYIATDAISEAVSGSSAKTVHRQRVIVDGARDARLIGNAPDEAAPALAAAWVSGPQAAGADLQSLLVAGSAGTKGVFRYTVPAGQDLLIRELALVGLDDGAISGATFWGAPALANGLELELADSTGVAQLNLAKAPGALSGITTIKRNADLVMAGWSLSQPLPGMLVATWRPPYHEPVYLGPLERIEVRVADDLTSLLELRLAVRGRLMTAGG